MAKYRDYVDFQAAHKDAREQACYELGPLWKLVPGASVLARLPAKWVTCKIGVTPGVNKRAGKALRVARSPRDVRLPAAEFWEDGELPVGPEYFEEYAWDDGSAIPAPSNMNGDFVWWQDQEVLPEAAD